MSVSTCSRSAQSVLFMPEVEAVRLSAKLFCSFETARRHSLEHRGSLGLIMQSRGSDFRLIPCFSESIIKINDVQPLRRAFERDCDIGAIFRTYSGRT
jgi:hypothetical protein